MSSSTPDAPPKATPPPAAASTSLKRASFFHPYGIVRRVGTAATRSLALVGFATVASLAYEYKVATDVKKDKAKVKKRVLVLPFHKMKLVETKKFSLPQTLAEFSDEQHDGDDRVMEVEVKELVNVIHQAAQDPNIVALYGIFGHGFQFSSGGWAHIEEVRNALKVFRESHRVHREPNLKHEEVLVRHGNATPKPTFCYADSFAHPMDPANKEYYLASAFSHVHLQPQGELAMFGLGSANYFLRGALEKYGIQAHVFKHGKYKNAANVVTEKGYTRDHKLNVKNIVDSVNQQICDRIVQMRSMTGFDDRLWKLVRQHGTFTAAHAHSIGLIDYMPRLDPLDSLVYSNSSSEAKEEMKAKWGKDTDLHNFDATEKISFSKYSSLVAKRKRVEDRQWKFHSRIKHMAETSTATEHLLSALGYKGPHYNIDKDKYTKEKAEAIKEKIALVNIDGGINDSMARKTVNTLRKIKKDKNVKCVVLRVNSPGGSPTASEAILQQCRDLPQPVVCSMGNVAASGGYYVATDCDRIFALPNTITGSIGVFAVKLDMRGLAKSYGVTVQHTETGPHTFSYDPFHPLTRPMKANFTRNVDRVYDYFKSIVARGRALSMEQVEEIAQGRVWTGEQAKSVGLVDELGGLVRAVAYAKRKYTSGEATVEVWPKPKKFWENIIHVDQNVAAPWLVRLLAMLGGVWDATSFTSSLDYSDDQMDACQALLSLVENDFAGSHSVAVPNTLTGISLAADENLAIRNVLLDWKRAGNTGSPLLAPDFWV